QDEERGKETQAVQRRQMRARYGNGGIDRRNGCRRWVNGTCEHNLPRDCFARLQDRRRPNNTRRAEHWRWCDNFSTDAALSPPAENAWRWTNRPPQAQSRLRETDANATNQKGSRTLRGYAHSRAGSARHRARGAIHPLLRGGDDSPPKRMAGAQSFDRNT